MATQLQTLDPPPGDSAPSTLPADSSSEDERQKPPRKVHGVAWFLVVCSVLSSTFLFGLDTTIVAVVQPTIVTEFDALQDLPWLFTAFMLGAAATNLFWGQVYSNFNTKWTYIGCICLFEVGSAISGVAPNMSAMIVGRAVCGAGGAGMYTGVMTFLSVLTADQERSLYLGIPGLTWGIATVLGPIIGGAFTESSVGWRFAFYFNLFVGALFAPITIFLIPSRSPHSGATLAQRTGRLDWAGLVLMTGIFVALLMAISFGGLTYLWNSGQIIALFAVAGVLVIIYWTQQTFCLGTARGVRTIPFEFLRNTPLMIIFFNETFASTAGFIPVSFVPLFFQFVRGDSALHSGVRLLPLVCLLVAMILLAGYVASKTGKTTPIFFFGGALVLAGGALMYTVDANASDAQVYAYTAILGTGAGVYFNVPFSAAQACTDPDLIPVAVGFISFAQLASPAMSIAIANAVFLSQSTQNIASLLPGADETLVHGIISGVEKSYVDSLDPPTRDALIGIIVGAMRNAYVLVIAAGALTLILSPVLLFFRKTQRAPPTTQVLF
ncbi:hypothetical protein DL768_011336 [Monosporascus sp. mg162]|nr:hypothetical protein DL768_011336 [Monosporascus sp. mg162]